MNSQISKNNSQLSVAASDKVEDICKKGCSEVSELLVKVKNGDEINELSNFNQDEIQQIIAELSEIMSVYDDDSTQ